MTKIKKLLTKGNSKLDKEVLTWSIPAGMEVCGRECRGCYAITEQNRWKNVRTSRERKYEFSKTEEFVPQMVAELKKYGKKYVRVHASGEFYSQEYIGKWVDIARQCPELIFYTYTKRMKDFDFSDVKALPNFVLHNSYIETDSGIVVNYGEESFVKDLEENYEAFVCPLAKDRTGMCGKSCVWCMEKENEGTPIVFEQH